MGKWEWIVSIFIIVHSQFYKYSADKVSFLAINNIHVSAL